MIEPQLLIEQFRTTHWVVLNQAEGLRHDDSLIQPPVRGNCLNWVCGHIVVYRERVLDMMGIPGTWTEEEIARYTFDSEPITSADDPGILPFDRLLSDFERTQELLEEGFAEISEQQLAETNEQGRSVADRILFLAWHEGYHLGQTEYLRQLAGKDDSIP